MVERAGTVDAPMTRAQKFQWLLEKGIADELWRLSGSWDESSVAGLVETLQQEYQTLRTSIEDIDGALRQRVHPSGAPLVVIDVVPGTDVQARYSALREEFTGHTVGRPGQFLAKPYLLRQHDHSWLAIIADCTAADRVFFQILGARLAELLEGRAGENAFAGLEPVEVARREDSPEGRAERHEALDYLRRHFSTAPAALHVRDHEPSEERFYRATLTLRRADEVFANIIETTERLPSVVVLGLFSSLTCWRVDVPACTVNVSMENRHTKDLRRALGATAQRAPVAVSMAGESLDDAIRAAQAALTAGYPVAGRYDPVDLLEERARAEARRGVCLTPDLAFNFNPPRQGWTELLRSARAGREAAPEDETPVVVTFTNETWYEYAASLSVRWSDAHTVRLSIHGDSQVLRPAECAAVLRGVETGLKAVAYGDQHADVAKIAASAKLGKGGA